MSPQNPINAVAVQNDELGSRAKELWKKCHVSSRASHVAYLLRRSVPPSKDPSSCMNSLYFSKSELEAFNDGPTTLVECEAGFDVNDLTVTHPNLVSNFEREYYYHGVYPDVVKLLYRTDIESNPFPHPSPGDTRFHVPIKTLGSYNMGSDLRKMRYDIFNALCESPGIFMSFGVKMFSYQHADGRETFGPFVIWIVSEPGETEAVEAREACLNALRVVQEHDLPDFQDTVVEWVEHFSDLELDW